jgi:predicted secreted protein
MKVLTVTCVLFLAALSASAKTRIFKGQIMDSECASNAHSVTHSHVEMAGMKGEINARQCTILCVEQGDSVYMFLDQDGSTGYKLSTPQKDLKQYAGDKVEITGELGDSGKLIHVTKIRSLGEAKVR